MKTLVLAKKHRSNNKPYNHPRTILLLTAQHSTRRKLNRREPSADPECGVPMTDSSSEVCFDNTIVSIRSINAVLFPKISRDNSPAPPGCARALNSSKKQIANLNHHPMSRCLTIRLGENSVFQPLTITSQPRLNSPKHLGFFIPQKVPTFHEHPSFDPRRHAAPWVSDGSCRDMTSARS